MFIKNGKDRRVGKQEKAEKASFDEMKENEALVTF